MPARDGTDPAGLGSDEDDDGHALLGTVIEGRYRLDSVIGRGGMGLVYKASHLTLRRSVAVKILHPSLIASPDVRNRFEREVLASGKIDHPNCVGVYDSGRLPDGSLYLAMEFLDGHSLADVLEREGQLAPGRALHILAGILRGLQHIHQAGLIHRDIKPENIFLIRQGEDVDFAKILDFGIAKGMTGSDLDEGVKLTQAGMAFGTPIYMAPEQALGNPMDGRADLYAAAVMGYEMLTGQPPFYSDDKLEVMSAHTARPVPAMRTKLVKGGKPVPSSIERLIVRGLTKKPADRYATAELFLSAVEEALHTPDGGVTDVSFERPTTGSQPLVDFVDPGLNQDHIAAAIDEELSVPNAAPVKRTTPHAGALAPSTLPATPSPRGGVGLGLPYTGPAGEPIFGLTPEQRLQQSTEAPRKPLGVAGGTRRATTVAADVDERAQTRPLDRTDLGSSKKGLLYGGIAAAAIAAGIVIAVVVGRGGGGSTEDALKLDPNSPAGQANAALKRGDVDKALSLLESNKVAIANDGAAQLVLGRAYVAKHDSKHALDAYDTALRTLPAVEKDPELRASLRSMAGDPDPTVVAAAFEIWVGKTGDPDAQPLLLKAAVADNIVRRHAVRPVVETLKLLDKVDWLVAYSYDLDQEQTCELRNAAVEKLNALNDARAVPALERAVAKKIKSGPQRGKPFSPCLIDNAKAAIGYLRGLKK
ncbi:MAG TPA: protein kinase [Kofleriaceae bacterium]|jgi:serine/threonine protein kinase